MKKEYNVIQTEYMFPGATAIKHGISVRATLHGKNSNGILLWENADSEPIKIDFDDSCRKGSVYECVIQDIDTCGMTYMFHEDGEPVMDPYAKAIVGHNLFGDAHWKAGKKDAVTRCAFVQDYEWKDDFTPDFSFKDSILYCLHVRGFTQDASSKVKERGTYAGVSTKIPYLKELGINTVVLQPIIETEECCANPITDYRLNYWGYQDGYYYAPKNAYAYGDDASLELRQMVSALHQENIQVILQFCFTTPYKTDEIVDILLYWKMVYHVDGFWLMGENIQWAQLCENEYLTDVKIMGDGIPFYGMNTQKPQMNQHLCSIRRDYQLSARKYLKGDYDSLMSFVSAQRSRPQYYYEINHVASYDGFRLYDLVSYDGKHNQDNHENNNDGDDYNCSWNCGAEGDTKKKSIQNLRARQVKNALTYVFTSLGIPMIFMGDECGKSQHGNNNPYCQDNEITWKKWNLKKTDLELLEFTRRLIEIRKDSRAFTRDAVYKGMDSLGCGCPDISYHSQDAWQIDRASSHVGVLYCGRYLDTEESCDMPDYYVLYNSHWEKAVFAIPKTDSSREWEILLNTNREKPVFSADGQTVEIPDRTVAILISK